MGRLEIVFPGDIGEILEGVAREKEAKGAEVLREALATVYRIVPGEGKEGKVKTTANPERNF